jgi:hypothetical protein
MEPVLRCALIILLATSAAPAVDARAAGKRVFSFQCSVGGNKVTVKTENGRLVYRFGSPRRPQQTIVQAGDSSNVFYRYQLWPTSNTQQLRFRTGRTSYVIYNHFRAADYFGRGSTDRSGVLVLDGKRVRARYKCRSGGHFDEDHQFDRLPVDPLDLPVSSG